MKINRIITLTNGKELKLTATFWDIFGSTWSMKQYHDGKNAVLIPTTSISTIVKIREEKN